MLSLQPMLETFATLNTLDLRDNSFMCHEGVQKFHEMWESRSEELAVAGYEGGDGYLCQVESTGELVTFLEYAARDIVTTAATPGSAPFVQDQDKGGKIRVGLGASIVGTALILIAAVVFTQRRKIRSLLREGRWQPPRPEPEGGFTFDVFVCYSPVESRWVSEELLPVLEGHPANMKVCVHERDFELGLQIRQNIESALESSRKFLLVLSADMPDRQWCMFEVKEALERMGSSNIAVVVRDKPECMPDSLKRLLSDRTYVRWPQEAAKRENFHQNLVTSLRRR